MKLTVHHVLCVSNQNGWLSVIIVSICAVAGQKDAHTDTHHLHTSSSNALGNEGAKSLNLQAMQSLKSVDLRCLNAAEVTYNA